jgi:hypothetical protein
MNKLRQSAMTKPATSKLTKPEKNPKTVEQAPKPPGFQK